MPIFIFIIAFCNFPPFPRTETQHRRKKETKRPRDSSLHHPSHVRRCTTSIITGMTQKMDGEIFSSPSHLREYRIKSTSFCFPSWGVGDVREPFRKAHRRGTPHHMQGKIYRDGALVAACTKPRHFTVRTVCYSLGLLNCNSVSSTHTLRRRLAFVLHFVCTSFSEKKKKSG